METNYEQEEGIALGDLFNAILKNIWAVITITLLITILGAVYTFTLAKEKYQSTSTIIVAITQNNSSGLDYDNSSKLIYTVRDLIKQDIVLGDVAKDYNLDYEKFKENVEVTSNSNSFLLTISVTDSDPNLTKEVTNAIVLELINEINNNSALAFAKGTVTQTSSAVEGIYYSPNKFLYLAASSVIGGIIGISFAIGLEFASTKFKNKKEVENILNDKVIGVFYDDYKKRKLAKDGSKTINLITPSLRNFEPYNKLLSNIKYSNLESPYKVIMTSSNGMNELKSTICSNLAYCIANNNKKVIIIDLDTRKPVLYRTFKVERANGLVEYIEGIINQEQLIKHSNYGVDVITSGKKVINPMVILEAKKLEELINNLKKDYDYILIDTPPIGICYDAMIVSKLCDGVVFNIAMNQSRKSEVKNSLNLLKEVNAKIIGLNLTKFPNSARDLTYIEYEEDKA